MMSTVSRQVSSPDVSSPPTLTLQAQLFSQQVAQLYALAPIGIVASLINGLILVFLLWKVVAVDVLLSWLASGIVVNAARFVLVYRYRTITPPPHTAGRWGHWFLASNLASGLVWGSAGIWLYPTDSLPHEIVLIFVLGGMIAGSTAMHSALQSAFWAFSIPTALPLIVRLFQQSDERHLAMGLMSLLFMAMMTLTARRNYLMTRSSMTLRHENAQLLEQVSIARDHLESIVKTRTIELQTSETRYRFLAENIRDVIWVMALDGSHFTYISPSILALCGYTSEEALTLSLEDILTPDSAQKARVAIGEELALEHAAHADRIRSRTLELEHRCKDGTTVWAEVRGSILHDEQQQVIGVVGVTRDVTERKMMDEEKQHLESQLLRAQKVEAIGTLAGGIAHDFNNFLTSVLGNLTLAKQSDLTTQSRVEFLIKAEQATLRAKDLTQQLLTFAKGGEPIKQLMALDTVIRESASFSLSGTAVACEYVFPPNLWPADADPGQMSQVIHNLVRNAVEAMPHGGTMTIQAENFLLPTKTTDKSIPLPPGPYLKVSLSDEGTGIPEDQLPRIFDPYYTTKSEGHGLGLASAYSIMKKHGGLILVESKLGVGTEFTLIFPASPDAQLPGESNMAHLTRGTGRILVMDDDEHIRLVARELLKRCGYQCEPAKDGHEAIALYKTAMKCEQPFSAVILDLTVPGGIGGKETLRRLQQIDPQVKAIVSSGYSNNPIMANYQIHGFQGVVLKPYMIEDLSKVLYQVVMEESKK